MSTNQNDPDFPTINIDMDEHRPISAKKQSSEPNKSAKEPNQANRKSSASILVGLSLVVALGASAGCFYLYQQLQTTQSEATRTEQRLLSLEDKLSATGEEIGNSTVALQVKVTELSSTSKELWDQMDKLWASAWRRNQQDIKALESQVTEVKSNSQTQISAIEKKTKASESTTQQMLARVDALNSKLNNQANDILSASVSAEQASQAAQGQTGKISELNEKILLLEKRNTSLLNRIDDLETQIRELATKTVSNNSQVSHKTHSARLLETE